MPRMVTRSHSLMAMVFGPPRLVRLPSTAPSPVMAISWTPSAAMQGVVEIGGLLVGDGLERQRFVRIEIGVIGAGQDDGAGGKMQRDVALQVNGAAQVASGRHDDGTAARRSAASMAFWMAAVSLTAPSPFAPKARTSKESAALKREQGKSTHKR